MFEAVERTTCMISPASRAPSILPCSAAFRPSDATSIATPAWVGADSEVEPPMFGTENSECSSKLVSLERSR